jgi:uncharacterized protein with HEPN domain
VSKRDVILFLYDILECIEKIERYVLGMSYKDFENDERTVDAVIRNLEIIGEAARNIPPELRDKYSDIPWRRIVGLRNVVIHEYFGVDLENIWEILVNDLPNLKDKVRSILEKESKCP